MITLRRTTTETEMLHWLLVIIAALVMVLAVATVLALAEEPALLPAGTQEEAQPMPEMPGRPFFPEGDPHRELAPAEIAARLWMILEQHQAGCFAEAIGGWEAVRLPEKTAVWREIGLAAAYREAGDQVHAMMRLEEARKLAPRNPVVAYYMGLARMDQAAEIARELEYGIAPKTITPLEDMAVLELMAIGEFQTAIETAADVDATERLVITDEQYEEEGVVPRVGDLLVVLRAARFAGKAHERLFEIHVKRGELAFAEMNVAAAFEEGVEIADGMRQIAAAYGETGANGEAIRVLHDDLQMRYPRVEQEMMRIAGVLRLPPQGTWVW